MNKFKYTLYAKCYCDENNKNYAELNTEEKIKEFAELFLKADIDTITTKTFENKSSSYKAQFNKTSSRFNEGP